jgi:hypothetical protein
MELRRDDFDLAGELTALRPSPRPAFAAELDARAAAGFPRRGPRSAPRFGSVFARLRTTPPRRLLVPAGAVAVLAIAIATAAVSISQEEKAPTEVTAARLAGRPGAEAEPLPRAVQRALLPRAEHDAGAASSNANAAAGVGSSGVEYSQTLPPEVRLQHGAGPYASRASRREIERSASLVLGADPADVRGDAAKVFDAVHATDGIVLRSSIRDGAAGDAGASFDLLIPSGKLGDALAAFSAIAEVRSRHESTQDITAPTIGVGERLQDARAKVEGLLAELAAADTEAERVTAELELRRERQHVASLRSRLDTLRRRAHFSRVSLRIETGSGSASAGGAGSWGIDDALGDAGHILAIAAGVTVIGLAVLAPLALICLLAWLANRAWIRRRREQALS